MTYDGLSGMTDNSSPHLGGNIFEGDPFTYSPKVWDYIIDRFAVKSVLDLGSGLGYSSNYFFKKGCQVIAVDGFEKNCKLAKYPTIQCDLTKSSVYCSVDLVHCQEVVEHIEEEYLDNLLSSLTCGKIILMTHAYPGQGGYHHVNEQPAEYWINHLARYNCNLMQEDTTRIRHLASLDNAIYLANTGMIFSKL